MASARWCRIAWLGAEVQHATAADGLIVGPLRAGWRVELLTDAAAARAQVVVAGCDPAIQLVAERILGHAMASRAVLGWPMGSTAAVDALRRGEVHVAGVTWWTRGRASRTRFVDSHLAGATSRS